MGSFSQLPKVLAYLLAQFTITRVIYVHGVITKEGRDVLDAANG